MSQEVTIKKVSGGFLLEQIDPNTFERKITVARTGKEAMEKAASIVDARPDKDEKLLPSTPIDIGDGL